MLIVSGYANSFMKSGSNDVISVESKRNRSGNCRIGTGLGKSEAITAILSNANIHTDPHNVVFHMNMLWTILRGKLHFSPPTIWSVHN